MDLRAARQQEFADALAALLRTYADVAGPVINPDGGIFDAEALANGVPVANPTLTEWITIMCWVDPESGDAYITKAGHHEQGLLSGWLAGLRG